MSEPTKFLRQHGKNFEVVDNKEEFPDEVLIPVHNEPTDRQREILAKYGHDIVDD